MPDTTMLMDHAGYQAKRTVGDVTARVTICRQELLWIAKVYETRRSHAEVLFDRTIEYARDGDLAGALNRSKQWAQSSVAELLGSPDLTPLDWTRNSCLEHSGKVVRLKAIVEGWFLQPADPAKFKWEDSADGVVITVWPNEEKFPFSRRMIEDIIDRQSEETIRSVRRAIAKLLDR